VALGQVFSEYFGFPCQFSLYQLLHTHHLSSGAGTISQLVADVPSELSLTPPRETKKRKKEKKRKLIVTLCCLVDRYQRFGATCCLHFHYLEDGGSRFLEYVSTVLPISFIFQIIPLIEINFQNVILRSGLCSSNDLGLYSRDTRLESCPAYNLFWPVFIVVFLSLYGQMPGLNPEITNAPLQIVSFLL
jgi:hypothetical protein